MKLRARSGLKGIIIPAIAALFLGFGIVGCSSSSDGAEPDAAMTEEGAAASNSDPLANDANAGAEGENGAVPAEGEAAATANNAAPANNAAAGSELQNLVNDGSGNAAGAAPADPGLNNAAGQDPFAANASNATATPPENGAAAPEGESAVTNPAADPFGPTATNSAPVADGAAAIPENPTAPVNPSADPALEAGAETAAAPTADESGAGAPAPVSDASAGGAASPGYVPENGAKMAYYIQKGDTLGTIAQKIYGSKGKWKQLQQENNLSDPHKIYAGDVVYYTVDNSSKGFADKYEGASKQSVTVAQGDSLSSISAKVFGSQGSWRTLWKQNPQVKNPDVIKVGMVLQYTAPQSVVTVAEASQEVTAENDQE